MNKQVCLFALLLSLPCLSLASPGKQPARLAPQGQAPHESNSTFPQKDKEGLQVAGDITDIGFRGKAPKAKEEAAIYGADNRKMVSRANYPYSAVLLMDGEFVTSELPMKCLATLVSECHAVSARHCVISTKAEAMNKDRKAQGLGEDEMFPVRASQLNVFDGSAQTATVNAFEAGRTGDDSDDYSFLRLNKKLGASNGFVGVVNRPANKFTVNSKLITVGRAFDKTDGRRVHIDDTATVMFEQTDEAILKLRADTYIGDSGGPVFPQFKDGQVFLAAVISRSTVSTEYENGKKIQPKVSDNPAQNRQGSYVAAGRFYRELVAFMKKYPCK